MTEESIGKEGIPLYRDPKKREEISKRVYLEHCLRGFHISIQSAVHHLKLSLDYSDSEMTTYLDSYLERLEDIEDESHYLLGKL